MARTIIFARRQRVTAARSTVLGYAVQLRLGDQADIHVDMATAIQIADQLRAHSATALPGGSAWRARVGVDDVKYEREDPEADYTGPAPGFPVGRGPGRRVQEEVIHA